MASTLSLPAPVLRKLRAAAAKRNVSMSSLVTSEITKMVLDDEDYDARAAPMIECMKNMPGSGIGGKITWTREELYDRVRRRRFIF